MAAQLEWSRTRRLRVSFEADEANEQLWGLIHELPGQPDPELLLFSTDVDP